MRITFEGTWEELQSFAAKIAPPLPPPANTDALPAPASRNPLSYPGIIAALRDKRMIDAIKLFRAATGCSLKEAKDACESAYESACRGVTA